MFLLIRHNFDFQFVRHSAGDLGTATATANLSGTDFDPGTCYTACGSDDTTYVAIDGNGDCKCYSDSPFSGTALGDSSICSYICPGAASSSDETCGRTASFDSALFSVYSEISLHLHPPSNGPGAGDAWATSGTAATQCGSTVSYAGATIEYYSMIDDGLLASDGSAIDNSSLVYQFDECSGTVSASPITNRREHLLTRSEAVPV